MAGQGRPIGRNVAWVLAALVLLPVATAAAAVPEITIAAREDAELADVLFLDVQRGWAVGDRGVIWHTTDGGRNWQIQASHVDCRLESIHFLDQQNGWIAGGYYLPYSHASRGVLLRTRDGGRSWQGESQLMLPALKRVRFFDTRHGVALGCSSALFPSGLFATLDGGRSWAPLGSGTAGDWISGDIGSPGSVALAGQAGTAAFLVQKELAPAVIEDARWRNLRDLKRTGDGGAWLVGDGGLVRWSRDEGRSWQPPPGQIPATARHLFDWSAVEARGNRCWVAGSPGSRILHSDDGGKTWSFADTGQCAPLRGLCFVDDRHGWAVGALGTILATSDGGRTWKQQLGTASRAALAAFGTDMEHIPLELFSRYCAGDGYLGMAFLLTRHDLGPDARQTSGAAERAHQAIVSVGGCGAETAWQFPLSQPAVRLDAHQVLDGWSRFSDGDAREDLVEYVVRQIRCWRPDIVIAPAADPRDNNPTALLVSHLVLRAVEDAGDEARFPQQITVAGLEAWRVKKVYGVVGANQPAPIDLSTSQLVTQLGRTLSDVAAPAWGLVSPRIGPLPESWGFRLYTNRLSDDRTGSDFFGGLALAPGGECRRRRLDADFRSIDEVKAIGQRIRNFQAILQHADRRQGYAAGLWSQVDSLLAQLDPASGSLVLLRLAIARQEEGRLEEASEALVKLVGRYPGESICPAALTWLLHYHASGEAALLEGPKPAVDAKLSPSGPDLAGNIRATSADVPRREPPDTATSAVQKAPGGTGLQATHPTLASIVKAQAVAEQIRQIDAALYSEPIVRFPLAVALRKAGKDEEADRLRDGILRHALRDGAWWQCAASETWLRGRSSAPPKPVWYCTRSSTRPYLDGRLDDAVWQSAGRIAIASPQGDDAQWPATAMIAYDREFLYLALSCRRAPGCDYPVAQQPRPRDADLTSHDRVELLIDVDRDWTSFLRLSVDSRGWTGEASLGTSSWNPTWFVAQEDDGRQWTIEAAVPLRELSLQPPQSGDAWSVGVQRMVPGVGFQSWSRPASPAVRPEGFGLLVFK